MLDKSAIELKNTGGDSSQVASIKLKDLFNEILKKLNLKSKDGKMIRFLDANNMKVLTKSD